jgi:hypothetical protein
MAAAIGYAQSAAPVDVGTANTTIAQVQFTLAARSWLLLLVTISKTSAAGSQAGQARISTGLNNPRDCDVGSMILQTTSQTITCFNMRAVDPGTYTAYASAGFPVATVGVSGSIGVVNLGPAA